MNLFFPPLLLQILFFLQKNCCHSKSSFPFLNQHTVLKQISPDHELHFDWQCFCDAYSAILGTFTTEHSSHEKTKANDSCCRLKDSFYETGRFSPHTQSPYMILLEATWPQQHRNSPVTHFLLRCRATSDFLKPSKLKRRLARRLAAATSAQRLPLVRVSLLPRPSLSLRSWSSSESVARRALSRLKNTEKKTFHLTDWLKMRKSGSLATLKLKLSNREH